MSDNFIIGQLSENFIIHRTAYENDSGQNFVEKEFSENSWWIFGIFLFLPLMNYLLLNWIACDIP